MDESLVNIAIGVGSALLTAIGALLIVYIRKVEKVEQIKVLEVKLELLIDRVSDLVESVNRTIQIEHEHDKRISETEQTVIRLSERTHNHSNDITRIKMSMGLRRED